MMESDRAQAELVARLAAAATDPQIANHYNQPALEHLSKASDVERAPENKTKSPRSGSPILNPRRTKS